MPLLSQSFSEKRHSSLHKIITLAAFLGALIGSGFALYQKHAEAKKKEQFVDSTVFLLKKELTDKLVDPESVRFKNVTLYFKPDVESPRKNNAAPSGQYTLCGQMNSRNRMGGYVGYSPFYSFVYINGATASFQDAPKLAMIANEYSSSDFGSKECAGTKLHEE